MKTCCVQIGNSDNKLTQEEWSKFCHSFDAAIRSRSGAVHFMGGSTWNAPWQNACWVSEVHDDGLPYLKVELARLRAKYQQTSVAILIGDTEFI